MSARRSLKRSSGLLFSFLLARWSKVGGASLSLDVEWNSGPWTYVMRWSVVSLDCNATGNKKGKYQSMNAIDQPKKIIHEL